MMNEWLHFQVFFFLVSANPAPDYGENFVYIRMEIGVFR